MATFTLRDRQAIYSLIITSYFIVLLLAGALALITQGITARVVVGPITLHSNIAGNRAYLLAPERG